MATQVRNTPVERGDCDRTGAVTRSLLGYGVLAGPFYLVVGLVQALTRKGYDLAHDDLSVLANGSLGWIQMTNLILSGLMTVAAAIGIRRAIRTAPRGRTWGPRLIAGYGGGLVLAGVFTADPMNGFPVGTPPGAHTVSWHGLLHLVAGGLGFLCLIAACFALARRFGRGWAVYSRVTGVLFGLSFLGIASGSTSAAVVLGFWLGIILAWAWLAAVSVRLYRATPTSAGG
jgi:hypothetical protein